MNTAPNIALPSIQPVLRPSFKRPMINDIIADTNNTLSVGSSKHSKMKSIILNGLSGGNLFVPNVFVRHSMSTLLFVEIPLLRFVLNILHKFSGELINDLYSSSVCFMFEL